jgi:hypothetical protein
LERETIDHKLVTIDLKLAFAVGIHGVELLLESGGNTAHREVFRIIVCRDCCRL